MRLRLNSKLKAALIAAVTAVGFTLPQSFAETNTARINTEDTSLISWFSFAENNGVTAGSKTTGWNNLLTFNTDGYGTTGADHSMNGGIEAKGGSFTISFDINSMGDGTLLHMNTAGGSGNWRHVDLTSTASDALTLTFKGKSGSPVEAAVEDEWTTVTITGNGQVLTMYLNGVSQGTIAMSDASNFNGEKLTSIRFGSENGSNVQTADLKNILVYNKALTASEVKALTSTEVYGTYTWVGDNDTNVWSSTANCWTKEGTTGSVPFPNDNDALFNTAGTTNTTVSIIDAVTAGTVTVDSAAYTFNLGEAGSLAAAKLVITGTGAKLTVNGAGRTMTIDALSNNGALEIGNGATVNLAAGVTLDATHALNVTGDGTLAIQKLTVSGGDHTLGVGLNMTEIGLNGGTVTFANGTSTVSGKVYSNSDTTTLVVGAETGTAVLKANRVELGDTNNTSKHHDLTINAGGTLKITGENTGTDYKSASLVLGEWNVTPTTVTVKGLLIADKVAATAGDSGYVMNINGGTALLKGLQRKDNNRKQELNITNNGSLILGATGIVGANTGNNVTLTVNNGTIGVYADSVTIDKAIALTGDVTFDTQKYTVNDITITRGEAGGTLTVSGNISGTGTITKDGAGELILSGAGNALTHTLQVNAGKLTISGSIAIDGIEDGEIEEGYVTARGEKVSDGNGFAYKSGILNVYNVEEGAELVNNGSFTYGGEAVTVDQDGRYALSETVDHTTLWVNSGTESYDTYHAASEGALTTAKVAGGATLAIGTNAVGTLAFKENGTTINVTGTGTVNAISGTGTLNLEEDAVVTLAPQGTPSAPTLSGAGTLVLAPSANVNCTITSFDEDWTGTLEINGTNGTPTLYLGSGATAKAGNLHMAAGAATIRLNGNTAKAVELDEVVMEKGTKLLSFYANYDGNDYASVNMSIGALTMKGDTATVGTTNHGGLINIGSITGSGTLTLTYESSSDAKTVLNLGGEDVEATTFHGTLDVYHNNNGNKRTTTLILNDEYTAADAVVQFRAVGAGTNSRALGIGLHADTVKVAGLNDGTIGSATGNNLYALYSGDYTGLDNRYDGGTDFYEEAGDDEWRTLEITGDGEYSTAIKVLDHVNLLMTGTGTQTFTGDMSEFNGSLTLKAGTVVVNSQLGEDAVVTVEGDATLDGDGIDATQVGIAADKTATFTQGIQDASGVEFLGEEGVQVKNTNEAGGDALLYDISKENAKVTADRLVVESVTDVTVKNKVVVGDIANIGEGNLTLTHVDVVEPLLGVYAHDGALTLQNITEVSVVEMVIASGSTVAVYTSENADVEGTVTITEKLMAGGGTLLANLEMANDSKLALSLTGGGMQALTLGSQFTIAEGALVRLDDATLAALDNLAVGGSLTLIKALDQTTLGYGDNNYDGTWYDAMFSRVDNEYSLAGDFQVFANETGFGLTKVSAVPEPTTGTLSLLALAALAARRRRK